MIDAYIMMFLITSNYIGFIQIHNLVQINIQDCFVQKSDAIYRPYIIHRLIILLLSYYNDQ